MKTTIAAKREAYQAISMMSKAKAFAIYSRLNAKGKIKRGDSFKAWTQRAVDATVAEWCKPSNVIGA